MRKGILMVVLASIAAGVVAGCSKPEEPAPQQPAPAQMPPGQKFGYPGAGAEKK